MRVFSFKIPVSLVLLTGALLAVVIDFGPSAGAYQTTRSYFSSEEQEAYTWLNEHAQEMQQTRLWDVSVMPRDEYLRSYSLSQTPMMRFSGYYDNGAPLYAWQQGAWTDLRTRLYLQQVRYVLVRDTDPGTDELRDQLHSFGFQIAFQAAEVQIWENRDMGEYARVREQVALDVTQDFHNPFKALPEFVWRDIAMVTPASYYLDDYGAAEINNYSYVLVDKPAAREPSNLDQLLPGLQNKMLTSDQVGQLPLARRPSTLTGQDSVFLDHWRDGQIRLLVRAAQKGILVLSESWYPHWRVWVDGQPQPVLRTDWALLGVWIEPGEHQVEFRFQRPWYVILGFVISGLTWLALTTWWAHETANRLKRSSRPMP